MAILTLTDGSAMIRADRVERSVFVNGVRRVDAEVEEVTMTGGVEPQTCSIKFPRFRYRQPPCRHGDRIEVFVDRSINPAPLFRGFVCTMRETKAGDNNGVLVQAHDVRRGLWDDFCSRNYNQTFKGVRTENLRLRGIVSAILAEYQEFQAAQGVPAAFRLQASLSSFPDRIVGEYLVKGEPHGAALQRVLDEFGRGNYRLAVEYNPSSSVLYVYEVGQGLLQEVTVATVQTAGPSAQPGGRANGDDLQREDNEAQVVNDLTLESGEVLFEARVALAENWPGAGNNEDFERLLINQDVMPEVPTIGGVIPGFFEPKVRGVGQRYLIPEVVDLDGVPRKLDLIAELVQADYYTGDVYAKLPNAPFVAWERGDIADQYQLLFDSFSINGNELWFEHPRFRWLQTTERTEAIIVCDTPVQLAAYGQVFYWGTAGNLTAAEILADTETGVWDGRNRTGTKFTVTPHDCTTAPPLTDSDEILYDPVRGVFVAEEPVVLYGVGASRTRQKTYPLGTLYLNATWVSRAFTRVSTGKGGDASRRVRRMSTVAGFQRRVLRDHVRIVEAPLTVGIDITAASGTLVTGADITVTDPSVAMGIVAQARREPIMQPARVITATLPRGEVGFRIGAQLSENGTPTGCNIVEIKYDLLSMTTRLVASNR